MDRDEAQELLRNFFADPPSARRLPTTCSCPTPTRPSPRSGTRSPPSCSATWRDGRCPHELRAALRLARRSDDGARVADVMATLGTTLCWWVASGRDGAARPRHGRAPRAPARSAAPPTRLRRGVILARFERVVDLRRARELFSAPGPGVGGSRAQPAGPGDVKLGELVVPAASRRSPAPADTATPMPCRPRSTISAGWPSSPATCPWRWTVRRGQRDLRRPWRHQRRPRPRSGRRLPVRWAGG